MKPDLSRKIPYSIYSLGGLFPNIRLDRYIYVCKLYARESFVLVFDLVLVSREKDVRKWFEAYKNVQRI
jgi:hypothetical protein